MAQLVQPESSALADRSLPSPLDVVIATPLPDASDRANVSHNAYHTAIVSALSGRRMTLARAISLLALHAEALTEAATLLLGALRNGHKALVAGNGGSAAEAQHFAAELVGRFKRERAPYAALALTTDTAILTAVANDYGYAEVFARQVRGLGQPGDVLLAFSTSGESENLARAAVAARECGVSVIAVTGQRASRLQTLADVCVQAPLTDTATVQEIHMLVTHILCDLVERELAGSDE